MKQHQFMTSLTVFLIGDVLFASLMTVQKDGKVGLKTEDLLQMVTHTRLLQELSKR
jgi:hypothetical protein